MGPNLLQRIPRWVWLASGATAITSLLGVWAFLYRDGKISGLALLRRVDGVPLTLRTASAFTAMQAAALADGIRLKLNSGFRTNAEQALLYAKYLLGGNLAAKPGYSNHQDGRSVDIDVGGNNPNSREYRWLAANARRFGFENDGKNFSKPEYWHWTLIS